MTRAVVVLNEPQHRELAAQMCFRAELGTIVEFVDRGTRSRDQNALMWALLTRLSKACEWHGQHYDAEDWRDFFMDKLKSPRLMPAEGPGFVQVGRSSGKLSVVEHHELIRLIKEFAARQGIEL